MSDAFGNLYEADNNSDVFEIAIDNIAGKGPRRQFRIQSPQPTLQHSSTTAAARPHPRRSPLHSPGLLRLHSQPRQQGPAQVLTYGASSGASFPTSLTFNPISTGINSATLAATDSLSNTGTATVSGTGTPAPPAATPTFSVPAGTYTTIQTVSISDTSTNAAIYYTTDGSTPTSASTAYTGPITVGATETINAIATGNGFSPGPVATALYTINLPTTAIPTFSVAAGTYTAPQTISIADATAGAAIYYTTDGSTPTASSTLYSEPIAVSVNETINAIAILANYNNSAIASAAYVINLPATSFTITSAVDTIIVPRGGSGTAKLTLTADAAFNGSISFACGGFLPIGATCTFAPTSVSLAEQGTATTTLTINVPASTAAVHHGPGPLLPGSMMAAAVALLGFRKRRRLQMMLLLLISGVGLTMFSGCSTTPTSSTASSQIAITATGASCPYNSPGCKSPTQVVQNLNLVLTVN